VHGHAVGAKPCERGLDAVRMAQAVTTPTVHAGAVNALQWTL
jgi:hypothetical protein